MHPSSFNLFRILPAMIVVALAIATATVVFAEPAPKADVAPAAPPAPPSPPSSPAPLPVPDKDNAPQPAALSLAKDAIVGLFLAEPAADFPAAALWYFAPNGTVYQNISNGFSAEQLSARDARIGAAHVSGNSLRIDWADGSHASGELVRDARSFRWEHRTFHAASAVAQRSDLMGRYELRRENGSKRWFHGRIELRDDGTFRGHLSLDSSAAERVHGTWSYSGYALSMKTSAGKLLRGLVVTDGHAPYLALDGAVYVHK